MAKFNTVLVLVVVILMCSGLPVMGNPFFQRADDSCVGRCGQTGVDNTKPCQCNPSCITYNDCCTDFLPTCNTCQGRCTAGYNAQWPCQCNDQCVDFANCCPDRTELCGGSSGTTVRPGSVTDAELRALSNKLHNDDVNGVQNIILDLQGTTSSGTFTDRAPLPLFQSMPATAFTGPTLSTLVALYPYYVVDCKVTEEMTPERLAAEEAFLDAVMATSVMQQAHEFIVSKNLLPDSTPAYFKEYLRTIWLGQYNRGGGIKGSSGLEHVFVGELNGNSISGFHSWINFYMEERSGRMNYLGYISKIDLGVASMIEMPMQWRGINKSISSISIASSPELDLAVATVCFLARKDSKCQLQGASGNNYAYQTYTLTQNGVTYVGSAYPTVP